MENSRYHLQLPISCKLLIVFFGGDMKNTGNKTRWILPKKLPFFKKRSLGASLLDVIMGTALTGIVMFAAGTAYVKNKKVQKAVYVNKAMSSFENQFKIATARLMDKHLRAYQEASDSSGNQCAPDSLCSSSGSSDARKAIFQNNLGSINTDFWNNRMLFRLIDNTNFDNVVSQPPYFASSSFQFQSKGRCSHDYNFYGTDKRELHFCLGIITNPPSSQIRQIFAEIKFIPWDFETNDNITLNTLLGSNDKDLSFGGMIQYTLYWTDTSSGTASFKHRNGSTYTLLPYLENTDYDPYSATLDQTKTTAIPSEESGSSGDSDSSGSSGSSSNGSYETFTNDGEVQVLGVDKNTADNVFFKASNPSGHWRYSYPLNDPSRTYYHIARGVTKYDPKAYAAFNFNNLCPGDFEVFATWMPEEGLRHYPGVGWKDTTPGYIKEVKDSNAVIFKGGKTPLHTVPDDFTDEDGMNWEHLGNVTLVNAAPTGLQVRFTNICSMPIMAERVRIVQTSGTGCCIPAIYKNEVLPREGYLSDFSKTGPWGNAIEYEGHMYFRDSERTNNNGSSVATFRFNDLKIGTYSVHATWRSYSSRAPNTLFTIKDATSGAPIASI